MKLALCLYVSLFYQTLWTHVKAERGTESKEAKNVAEYLQEEANRVQRKLSADSYEGPSLEFFELSTISLNSTILTTPEVFSAPTGNYVLLDSTLYKFDETLSSFSLIYSFTLDDISLLKSTTHEDSTFIFLSNKAGHSQIYGLEHDSVLLIQNIDIPNVSDAAFFVNDGDLYLIVSSNRDDSFAPTTIYKFTKTHFDEIETVLTTGATKLLAFSSGPSEVIAIFQYLPHRELTSLLFEFSSGELKKIQKFESQQPHLIMTFLYDEKRYLIVIGKSKTQTIYLWNGSELLWNVVDTDFVVRESTVYYKSGTPFLIFSKNDTGLVGFRLNDGFENFGGQVLEFASNFTNILKILQVKDALLIVGFKGDHLALTTLSSNTSLDQLKGNEERNKQSEVLPRCLLNLETAANKLRGQLREFLAKSSGFSVLGASADFVATGLNTASSSLSETATSFQDLTSRFETLKFMTEVYSTDPEVLIINGTTVVPALKADRAIAEDIHLAALNKKKWTPGNWLTKSSPQTLSGLVIFRALKVTDLKTSSRIGLFSDLVRQSQLNSFSGNIKAQNFVARDLVSQEINGIPFENVYLKRTNSNIWGSKRFKELTVDQAKIDNINDLKAVDLASTILNPDIADMNFGEKLEIENCQIGFDQGCRIESVLGRPVSNFLTTSTNQTIRSKFIFNTVLAKKIETKTTNGINLAKAAVIFGGSTTLVEGQVKIEAVQVKNNLTLSGEWNESMEKNGDHIAGTNASDFMQIYSGKVKVKGDLHVKNLNVTSGAKLMISRKEFDPNTDLQYWTKNTVQIVPTRFEAISGISSHHLLTRTINGVKIKDFLKTSDSQHKATNFHFKNVTVTGNLVLSENSAHLPDLRKIDAEAVKTSGSFEVSGKKVFEALKVRELQAKILDGVSVDEVTNTLSPARSATFKHLIIDGNLETANFSFPSINNVNLADLEANTLYIDRNQSVSGIAFENVQAQQLVVKRVNGVSMDQHVLKLENLKSVEVLKDLFINGDVVFHEIENVASINKFNTEAMLNNTLALYENGTFHGNVTVKTAAQIHDLTTNFINEVDLVKLSKRLLFKKWRNQEITEPFSFKRLKTENLVTPSVNNVNVTNLIDVSNPNLQVLSLKQQLKMANATIRESLNGRLVCDLRSAIFNLRNPLSQEWDHVVLNNTTFLDKGSVLEQIFSKVVTSERGLTISGTTNFTTHINASNVQASGRINNIRFEEVMEDALLKISSSEQVIDSDTTFLELKADTVMSQENTEVGNINDLNVPRLIKGIIDKDSIPAVITGRKTFFYGLQAENFHSSSVGGVNPESLVSLTNQRKVDFVAFESLRVKNLSVGAINSVEFDEFLSQRLLLNSEEEQVTNATYFFGKVTVDESLSCDSMNGIKIDDVVFDTGIQSIESRKHFVKDIKVLGNVTIEVVNGLKLSESYEKTAMIDESNDFSGVMQIMRPASIEGNITAVLLNGFSIEDMKRTVDKEIIELEADQIRDIASHVITFIEKNLNKTLRLPTEYKYLEKSTDLQISIPNTIDARVAETTEGVLIHLEAQESGTFCGLSDQCVCPVQYTMFISSENSVNPFTNKVSQRIYTYSNEHMVVNIITNSTSTNSFCTPNGTHTFNEVSYVGWTTAATPENPAAFFKYPLFINGYLSGVEFFTVQGVTYIVIGRYYDVVSDTYDLDLIVLKFNEDKTQLLEVQNIPTTKLWTLSLLYTAQGVVLIMGSSESSAGTQILRFTPEQGKFEFLRNVSAGCIEATGIVLGVDSLIVLADNYATLHIFQYDSKFDNYYFYQTFRMEDNVVGLSAFYTRDFGISDAYLAVVTSNSKYFIYSFQFIEGWRLESKGEMDEIKGLIPFRLNKKSYLFAPSAKLSSLLAVVQSDSN